MSILDMLPQITERMRGHGITTLDYQKGKTRLRLSLEPAHTPDAVSTPDGVFTATTPIPSPEMGCFQHMPDISDGETVRAGDIVGFVIVGAMRLPVLAPVSGILKLAPLPEGGIVGYGAPLGVVATP